jgi:hypothetical protein
MNLLNNNNTINNNTINNNEIINYEYYKESTNNINNINNINKIYYYLIDNNYILKKTNINIDRQLLYFVHKDNFSEVIKIIINNYKKNFNTIALQISLTIPLKNSNYEYTTKFNNIDKVWNYLKFHVNYLN